VFVISADPDVMLRRLRNHTCQIAVMHRKPEEKDLYYQAYLREQIYINFPDTHPLAAKTEIHAEDLRGMSILMYDVGFWVDLFRSRMPDTLFMIQHDTDTMDELVGLSRMPVFNSDLMMQEGYIPENCSRTMLKEDFAETE